MQIKLIYSIHAYLPVSFSKGSVGVYTRWITVHIRELFISRFIRDTLLKNYMW